MWSFRILTFSSAYRPSSYRGGEAYSTFGEFRGRVRVIFDAPDYSRSIGAYKHPYVGPLRAQLEMTTTLPLDRVDRHSENVTIRNDQSLFAAQPPRLPTDTFHLRFHHAWMRSRISVPSTVVVDLKPNVRTVTCAVAYVCFRRTLWKPFHLLFR
jgi:hypothetical protein